MKFLAALSRGESIATLLIASACVVVLYCYSNTRILVQDHTGAQLRIHPGAVFGTSMIDLKNGEPITLRRDSRQSLLILLSGTECPGCLDEAKIWDELATGHQRLRVLAVFVGTTSADVETYLRIHKPAYEVYRFAEPGGEAELGQDYGRPLKVLMDRWGRVRYAAGPTNNTAAQTGFGARILAFTTK